MSTFEFTRKSENNAKEKNFENIHFDVITAKIENQLWFSLIKTDFIYFFDRLNEFLFCF